MSEKISYNSIEAIINNSTSFSILHLINKSIGYSFHEHNHILYDLRTIIGNKKCNYIEIGTYLGSSAALILNHPFSTELTCIDPCLCSTIDKGNGAIYLRKNKVDQYNTVLTNLKNNNIHNHNFTFLKGYSTDDSVLKIVSKKKYDILFIDGSHEYKDVLNDFKLYYPFINQYGFIVFDDWITEKGVNKAVNKILKEYKLNVIGNFPNYQNAFIDKRYPNDRLNIFIVQKLELI